MPKQLKGLSVKLEIRILESDFDKSVKRLNNKYDNQCNNGNAEN